MNGYTLPMGESISAGWTASLEQQVEQAALDAGFDLARVASDQASENQWFAGWIESGFAGEMEYLKRRDEQGRLLRGRLQVAIPWARSVIVCAFVYNHAGPRSIDPAPPGAGWIARYAWSGRLVEGEGVKPTDYHDDLLARLHRVEAALQERSPCQTRCYVDTGPILERDFAAAAGIGWIGKNTCVINQQKGSWMLLGVIVTSLEKRTPDLPAADRCGSCTRCIDACPTDALIAPRIMNASRCISYLTIEKKGDIPEELREPIGRQVFGCDICQDVCPWNRKAPTAASSGLALRPELVNPLLSWLAEMDSADFKENFKYSPLERTKRKRIHRNIAIAMGNTKDPQYLPQLHAWQAGDDPVLSEAAAWAIRRIEAGGSASIGG
ncbi:MAG TPA: tRNA epoxyqueuosine(34) reductase QueG [Granulicella sp.]